MIGHNRIPEMPDNTLWGAPEIFNRLGWALCAMCVVTQAGGMVLAFGMPSLSPGLSSLMSLLLPMLLGYPLFGFLVRGLPAMPSGRREKFSPGDIGLLLLCSFGAAYLSNLVSVLLGRFSAALMGRETINPLLSLGEDLPLAVLLPVVCILAPLLEELVFRGLLLRRLLPFGERFAVVTSALMFALFHGNFSQLFYAFSVGVIFGAVAVRSGNIRYSVLLHGCLNLPSALLLGLEDVFPQELSQIPRQLLSEEGKLIAALLGGFSFFVVFCMAAFVFVLPWARQRLSLPEGAGKTYSYRLFFLSTGTACYVSLCALLLMLSLWG